MHADYKDIKERIDETPKWYDCHGVPRYAKFHPNLSPNIYAKEVLLLEIECQSCEQRFLVELNWAEFGYRESFKAFFEKRTRGISVYSPVHYGDPPRHDCVGDTMNSTPLAVREFWSKPNSDWERNQEYEWTLED